jgi:hypothetical protein
MSIEWGDGTGEREREFHDLMGKYVRLHSLQRAELNGREGRVFSWHAQTGRAGVRLVGEEKMLALKPDNLFEIDQLSEQS